MASAEHTTSLKRRFSTLQARVRRAHVSLTDDSRQTNRGVYMPKVSGEKPVITPSAEEQRTRHFESRYPPDGTDPHIRATDCVVQEFETRHPGRKAYGSDEFVSAISRRDLGRRGSPSNGDSLRL